MANVVEIVIKVDNAQADKALASTQAALQQVGVAGNVSMQGLASGSGAAVQGMEQVGTAARGMGQHITTSLDGVRLMSQEFGFRLPRALESMLSRVPAVTSAISGMMGAFAGVAVAEVLFRIGEGVYNLYTKYISLTAVADAYNKTVLAHRSEAWSDTKNIELTTERLNLATEAAKRFNEEAAQKSDSALHSITGKPTDLFYAHQLAENAVKNQEAADALFRRQQDQQHETNRLKIEAAHAGDGDLGREQKITAELQKQNQLRAEDARFSGQQGFDVGAMFAMRGPRGPSEASSLEAQSDRLKAQAERVNLAREERNQRVQMENEAVNAGLVGGARLKAQEEQAIAAVVQKYKDGEISKETSRAERAALESKYHSETMKQIADETDAVQKRADLERDASLTGLAKVQAEGQRKIDDVNDRQRKGLYADQNAPGAPSKIADQDRATAQAEQLRMMGDSEKQYREQQAAEDQRAQAEQLSGFAKIDAEVAASTQKRADEFAKMYGQMSHDSAQYIEAEKQLEQSEGVIAQSGDRQRAQLEQELRQQTLQQQTEAAQAERRIKASGITGWTEDYRRGIAEVQAAEAASIAKINAEQSKSGVTGTAFELYQQQKVAAEQKADAQIQQLNQQMAHQIAGVLQGAFDDPVHYIQNLMKKMMFNIMADWIAQSKLFSGTFGRMLGGGSTNAPTGSNGGFLGGGIAGVASGAANGTVSQASSAPGYSGTNSSGGSGGGFGGGIASASTIAQMGMGAASANASSSTNSGVDPWSDPSQMSSSDPSSPAYNGAAGSAATTASNAGAILTAGVGAYTGTKGIIGAFEQGSPGGILNGAMSGAAMGGSIGMLAGPMGALIGAGIGAAGGATAGLVGWATGEGGNLAASKYFKEQMRPQMEQAEQAYAKGSGDALSTISTIDGIASTGLAYIGGKYGSSTLAWTRAAYVDKERLYLEGQINSMAKGGKDYMSRSAAQFHTGGEISDFGDLSLGGGEGFIKTLLGERVANRTASSIHGSEIDMMNNGASPSDMAAHYLKSTGGSRTQAAQASSGDTHHWNVNAIDAQSFEKFLTHGGGMEAHAKAANRYASQYSGDAAHG